MAALEAPMGDFLASFNGSSKAVGASLKKYGVAKLDTQDMDMFSLDKPAVVKSSRAGSQNCYDVHASSGVTQARLHALRREGEDPEDHRARLERPLAARHLNRESPPEAARDFRIEHGGHARVERRGSVTEASGLFAGHRFGVPEHV